MKQETIYTYFKFNQEIIDLAFCGIKDSELKVNFIKRWGRDLDGKDKKYSYSASEQAKFNGYAVRFEQTLYFASYMKLLGYDDELIKSTIRSKYEEITSPNVKKISKDLKEVLKKYKIDINILEKAVDELELNERCFFQYYFGINRKQMTIEEIATVFDKTEYLVKSFLRQAQDKLPRCIEKVVRENNMKLNFPKKETKKVIKNEPSQKEIGQPGKKSIPNFLNNFKDEDRALVIQILNLYKNYKSDNKGYQIVIKQYGENYDTLNENIKLEQRDHCSKHNLLTQINIYINLIKENKLTLDKLTNKFLRRNSKENNTEANIEKLDKSNTVLKNKEEKPIKSKRGRQKESSFLVSFDKEKMDIVLELLKVYEEIDHPYILTIKKLYGPTYDKLNKEINLDKREQNQLNNFKTKLKDYLEEIFDEKSLEDVCQKIRTKSRKGEKKKSIKETPVLTMKTIVEKYRCMQYATGEELLVLTSKIDKKLDVEMISKILGISIKQVDYILIKYLHVFESNIPEIIKDILSRKNFTVQMIINFSFMKDRINSLTQLEKMYLYLKLESYHNDEWTEEKILDFLKLSNKDMKDYQIMTKYDDMNQLNLVLKK